MESSTQDAPVMGASSENPNVLSTFD
jgi:hypothetical protein